VTGNAGPFAGRRLVPRAVAAAASGCLAVGDFTGIGNELTLAESWNGRAWTVVKTPHP
jgi:hypothetical protein